MGSPITTPRHIGFEALTVFPEMFEPIMSTSIMGRARKAGIIDFKAHDLRSWTHDRHRTVDDAPFGGGQGMLMKPEPFYEALRELCPPDNPACVVFFTPTGEPFTQKVALELAEENRVMFVCGHYEGMDERVYELASRSLSIGDYVLTGGELPALVVIDAVARLLPGVLGDEASPVEESFSDGLLEFSQFTRPADFEGMRVPEVLLSGNHALIAFWRKADSIVRTCIRRPDLLSTASLNERERQVVEHVLSMIDSGVDVVTMTQTAYDELRESKTQRRRRLHKRIE